MKRTPADAADPLLVCDGVSYRYPEQDSGPPAVAGANLVIGRGQYVGLVGANGSGKSTLARLCNGLLAPTEGSVRVGPWDTRERYAAWRVRQAVGLVLQNPDNQLVASTVEEDVAFGPENLGLPPAEIRRRVEEALAAVGLSALRDRAAHALSGGQKQLVAVAGVLAMRPACLILDEATSMLDPRGRREVLATVERLNREHGIAVLLITHHLAEVRRCERLLVMAEGRIALAGPPAEVLADAGGLHACGLEPPTLVRLADALRAEGVPVPPGVHDPDGLVEFLCPSPSAS